VGSIPTWPAWINIASCGVLVVKSLRSIALAEKAKQVKKSENAVQRYVRETTGELRKVSWPTWPEARHLTILVLLVMVTVGLFLSLVDYLSRGLLNLVLGI
jgi:preprotein translocase subunit SecE